MAYIFYLVAALSFGGTLLGEESHLVRNLVNVNLGTTAGQQQQLLQFKQRIAQAPAVTDWVAEHLGYSTAPSCQYCCSVSLAVCDNWLGLALVLVLLIA